MIGDAPAEVDVLATAVINAAVMMHEQGLVTGTVGNISVRCDGGMLITPTRRHYDELRPCDLVEVPLPPPGPVPAWASREWRIHAAVYRTRPDLDAIAHTHSPYATARSFDRTPLAFLTEEGAYLGIDEIPVVPAVPGGSVELARLVAEQMQDGGACLLARHGVLAAGRTPREAVDLCAAIEQQAQVQYLLPRRRRLQRRRLRSRA